MNEDLLEFARAWKAGAAGAVHPTVGRRLNDCLRKAGEDPVPFARAVDERALSLAELLFREHGCAFDTEHGRSVASGRPNRLSSEQQRAA